MNNNIPFKPSRIASIDVFRALTMVIMLFVNDLPSVSGVPHWLLHAGFDEDMLGFSDIVFPAFLFVMGMSIPLAIESKIQKGTSGLETLQEIASRTFALIVMGLFTVNYGHLAPSVGISKSVYCILMLIGFALLWNTYPKREARSMKNIQTILKLLGACLLLVLIFVFKDNNDELFQRRWWGILGLIGWAYSFCAIIYLYNRKSPKRLIAAYLSFIILNILGSNKWLGPFNGLIPDNGCFQAFAMTGVLLTLLLKHSAIQWSMTKRLQIGLIAGVVLLLLSVISHKFWIISKLQATPTWLFLCTGISIIFYIFIYWLTDMKGKTKWFDSIKPAGMATLTCYLVSYLLYSIMQITEIRFPDIFYQSPLGILKSVAIAFIAVGITALLNRLVIKLKI